MGFIFPLIPALVGGKDTQSLLRGLWRRRKSNFGDRQTLSQNTAIIALIGERWVFVYLRAKNPSESLYEAHRGYLKRRCDLELGMAYRLLICMSLLRSRTNTIMIKSEIEYSGKLAECYKICLVRFGNENNCVNMTSLSLVW